MLPAPAQYLLSGGGTPANERYYRARAQAQARLSHAIASTPPKYRSVADLALTGRSYADMAKKLGCSPQTVRKRLRHPKAAPYLQALTDLQYLDSGPTEALKRHFLWDMATRNEHTAPRVALGAVQELNRMDQYRENMEKGVAGTGSGTVQITINTPELPRTTLDGEATIIDDAH